MKTRILLIALSLWTISNSAGALDLQKDLNSLGGNEALRERAKNLDPKNRVRVVQNRTVDRNLRLELGGHFGMVTGGDAYIKTQNWGGNLDFHFTPKWSLGLRYDKASNELTNEGRALYDNAQARQAAQMGFEVPDIDYPIETGLVVANYYPFYGKMSLTSSTVAQFDVYALIGYGRTRLLSGPSDTFAAGAGIGVWLGQHLTTRFEGRYQGFQDRPNGVARQLDTAVFNLSLGVLL